MKSKKEDVILELMHGLYLVASLLETAGLSGDVEYEYEQSETTFFDEYVDIYKKYESMQEQIHNLYQEVGSLLTSLKESNNIQEQ